VTPDLLRLAPLEPDPVHAARVRRACRARLARQSNRAPHARTAPVSMAPLAVPIVLGVLSVIYGVALLETTLRFEGLLR